MLRLAAPRPKVELTDGSVVPFANLDYAATAPALAAAADAVRDALPWYGSVHRGAGPLSRRSTLAYEQARETVADFLGARPDDHVVFTRNTTDAMNLLARALPAGTLTVTFLGEHHASLLPWPDAVRLPVPATPERAVTALASTLAALRSDDRRRPILVAVTGASNVTGEVWPLAELATVAHRFDARLAVDAAQLAPHRPVDLSTLDADYVALSGHKLYAPFGAGVLAGRADWLDDGPPYLAGGGASRAVDSSAEQVHWHSGPSRHEAGTPNLLGAVALAAVCVALATDGWSHVAREGVLSGRLKAGLLGIDGVATLQGFKGGVDRVGIASFVVSGVDSDTVARLLGERYGIGVRDGLFCAHPLTRRLLDEAGRDGTAVRASIGIGVDEDDIDRLVTAVAEIAHAATGRELSQASRRGC
jgi:selenocysteine lyase/cysteine desulfurase